MPLDVPIRVQTNDFSCGAVALQMMFEYDGIQATKWLKRLPNPVTGLSPDVVAACTHAGYHSRTIAGCMDVPLLKHLTGRGRPVICLVTSGDIGHYVVVTGVERGYVYANCPTLGKQRTPIPAWEASWVYSPGTPNELLRYGVAGFPA